MDEKITQKEDVVQRLTRELKDAKNFLESVIQSIGVGIIINEMNDKITYINRAGEKILGYSKDELIGKPFSLFAISNVLSGDASSTKMHSSKNCFGNSSQNFSNVFSAL